MMKHEIHKEREFRMRIPVSYRPMAELHIDIQYLIKSDRGYDKILFMVCPVSRYVKEATAIAVAEIILNRIVFEFGKPEDIIFDKDRAFANQVMSYINKTLGIKQTFISPYNHGSNKAERAIK